MLILGSTALTVGEAVNLTAIREPRTKEYLNLNGS
jgi:hypothetical protein